MNPPDSLIAPATRVTALEYPRSSLQPGASSGTLNVALESALADVEQVIVALSFERLGDSLLFLSVAQACHEYFSLMRKDTPTWVLLPLHHQLLLKCPVLRHATVSFEPSVLANHSCYGPKALVLTDLNSVPFTGRYHVFKKSDFFYPVIVEQLPEGAKEYRSLPARYYLTFEQQSGRVLSSSPNSVHPGFVFPTNPSIEVKLPRIVREYFARGDLVCALVATTNLPDKKQFGVYRFAKVAAEIRRKVNRNLLFVMIVSPSQAEILDCDSDFLDEIKAAQIIFLNSQDLVLLGYLFARCQLIVGNDTGLSHLASLSSVGMPISPPPTIILYSRHDYTRWTSGGDNVSPLFSPFSVYLKEHNLGTISDNVDDAKWGTAALASWFTVDMVVERALETILGV